ncbi:hypothetical protein AB0M12_04170 [Nocardia vinacea]|uniref:hypothetical protein n=1 Tax=Nocardia vinacea TaxID=96468 RepID=UPI003436E747
MSLPALIEPTGAVSRKINGRRHSDAEARDVIVLISWLSRLDDAELDARGPRLLSILADGLRAHRP